MNTSAIDADRKSLNMSRSSGTGTAPPARTRSTRMSVHFLAHPRFLMAATFVWPTVSIHFNR